MDQQKILVVGDACIDEFVYGRCTRLCPDAPVPVFIPLQHVQNGGMAKNVQENVRSLGFKCDILCQEHLVHKTRYVDEKTNHTFIRVDIGENSVQRISPSFLTKSYLSEYNAIIISDYNKGFLFEEDIEFICNNHDLVFIDTKKHIGKYCKDATYIKINEIEYNASRYILDNGDYDNNLIVTLGDQGCKFMGKIYPVNKVEVKDMSGAGDTFMSALVCSFLTTNNIVKSISYANKCASIVVQKKGVVVIEKNYLD